MKSTRPPRNPTPNPAKAGSPAPLAITDEFVNGVLARLHEDKPVRRGLPDWGRIHLDRPLPFLAVYRRPPEVQDDGTERLVVGEPAYLLASGDERLRRGVAKLVKALALFARKRFGSFLIVEVWAAGSTPPESDSPKPAFSILRRNGDVLADTVDALYRELKQFKIQRSPAEVAVVTRAKLSPPGLPQLLSAGEGEELNCHLLGIEMAPAYRDPKTGKIFPIILRALHRRVSRAIKQSFFEFSHSETTHLPPHFHALGRRKMVKAVWGADKELAEVSSAFDFLLQVTPSNPETAWRSFRRDHFEKPPPFIYRPHPVDPSLLKRRLFAIPLERVEDPTLSSLFRDQQEDLDRRLTMLGDLGTVRFLYGSFQLFGRADSWLLRLARKILDEVPSRSRDESGQGTVGAKAFAARAVKELDYYRKSCPEMWSRVEIREDVSSLIVSRGNVLVPKGLRIPAKRVEALIQHEIGTHVVTYFNGRAQPFRQLFVGLPQYEELQEALGVLAEYLAGGLSRPRLRILAARVVAAHMMGSGAGFVEVFRELDRSYDFEQRFAFNVAMRVFRGGGFTKDVVYLRGLVKLLDYLKAGGELEPLFVGKIGSMHVSIIEELRWRKVLSPLRVKPKYLDDPRFRERMEVLRQSGSVLDLIGRRKK